MDKFARDMDNVCKYIMRFFNFNTYFNSFIIVSDTANVSQSIDSQSSANNSTQADSSDDENNTLDAPNSRLDCGHVMENADYLEW